MQACGPTLTELLKNLGSADQTVWLAHFLKAHTTGPDTGVKNGMIHFTSDRAKIVVGKLGTYTVLFSSDNAEADEECLKGLAIDLGEHFPIVISEGDEPALRMSIGHALKRFVHA
jgi:hypothetical protein